MVARGACVVAPGDAWLLGGMRGCSGGHAWFFLGGVHDYFLGGMYGFIMGGVRGFSRGECAWFFQGVLCMVFSGGRAWFFLGGVNGFFGGWNAWFFSRGCAWFFLGGACIRYDKIWSMSGQYTSYWNAFLFSFKILTTNVKVYFTVFLLNTVCCLFFT